MRSYTYYVLCHSRLHLNVDVNGWLASFNESLELMLLTLVHVTIILSNTSLGGFF